MASNANRTYADASYEANGQTATFQVIIDEIADQEDGSVTRELSIFDSSTINVGRRGVLHQYAYFDVPFFEDMGRKARTITVEAIFIGDEHVEETNNFISMVEQDATGVLNHPQLILPLNVVPLDVKISYRDNNIGITELSINFIEAGEYLAPSTPIQNEIFGSNIAQTILTNRFLEETDPDSFLNDFPTGIDITTNNWWFRFLATDQNGNFLDANLDDPIERERAFRAIRDYYNGDEDALIGQYRVQNILDAISNGTGSNDFQDTVDLLVALISRNEREFETLRQRGGGFDPSRITDDYEVINQLLNNINVTNNEEVLELARIRSVVDQRYRFQLENSIQGPPTANYQNSEDPSPLPTFVNIYLDYLGGVKDFFFSGDDPMFSTSGYTSN